MKAVKLPSGSWRIQCYAGTENGKRKYRSFTAPTKAEAEYMAATWKKEGRKKPSDLTVGAAVDQYIALCSTLSPTTIDSYKKIRANAFQDLAERPVKALTDAIVQASINTEARRKTYAGRTIAPKTVRCEWALFSTALKTVCGMTFAAKLPKIQPKLRDLPDPQTVIDLVRGTEIELPCLLALWCGLRLCEIKGLTHASIHGDMIFIDKIMVYANGRELIKPTAKTATSIRKIRVPGYIMNLIPADDPIIPLTRTAIHHRFRRLMAQNGIDMTFHGLRHMYASISLSVLQIPSKSVQVSGGWATAAIMDQVYSQTYNVIQQDADRRREAFFTDLLQHGNATRQAETLDK